jgi:hypothetical protein
MYKKQAIYGIILMFLASAASAARVGVVVDDGVGGVTTRCYEVDDGSMADFVCGKSGFECMDFGGSLGKALCNVFGTGCSAGDCFCSSSFWGFSTKTGGSWQFSFTSGVSLVEVEDGMLLGFRWDSDWGATPDANPSFCDVCGCGGKAVRIPKILGMAVLPEEPTVDKPVTIELRDNKTEKPIKYALVEVFEGMVGITAPLFKGQSDGDGQVEFHVSEPGQYNVRIAATKYPHQYMKLKVSETTTTTTTPSTTTTTSTTSTTSTTIKLPEHFLLETTTTTAAPTTTLGAPQVIGAAAAPPQKEGGGGGALWSLFTWLLNIL